MKNIKSKNNLAGNLYSVNLEKNTIYNIFTKNGNYRGGKIYSENKYFTILSGKVEVTIFDGKKDIKNIYEKGKIFEIKKGVPNIFYFLKDSEILEWFSKEAKSEKYQRYYDLKS